MDRSEHPDKGERLVGHRHGDSASATRPVKIAEWAVRSVMLATAAAVGPSLMVAQSAPTPARDARAAVKDFAISAGSLREALNAFSRETGINVIDPGALVRDQPSKGVAGTMSPDDALRALLEDSGVSFRFANARTVRLQPVGTTTQLSSVTVTGSRAQQPSSSKYTEPVRDIPQSITVVPLSVLESQGVTSLRDAVRNVSGLTVNAGEGGGHTG